MSTFDSDDRKTQGYFLPQDSQLRLQKLRDYAEFLSHITQPCASDVAQQRVPEMDAGQVTGCLQLLARQVGLVLDHLSFPAYRSESEKAPAATVKSETSEAMLSEAAGRYFCGMTVDQVDTLRHLIDMISAHGDVVSASHGTELADRTLSSLGHAIFTDASAVREIIRQVESQRLVPKRGSHTGVSEQPGVYEVKTESGSGTNAWFRNLGQSALLLRANFIKAAVTACSVGESKDALDSCCDQGSRLHGLCMA